MDDVSHRFRFFRAGGFDQVLLDQAEDLLALDQLDPKLWVALSCPVQGLEFDEKTLRLIDADGDGRIRVPEILAAVRWATGMLRDPGRLVDGGDSLAVADVSEDHAEGRQVRAASLRILRELGGDLDTISLAQVTGAAKTYARLKLNGDGVVPPASADDEAVAKAIADIVSCVGGQVDRNGDSGVTREKVEAFFAAAQAFDAGWREAEARAATVLPLGPATAEATRIVSEVGEKVEDWFTRCRVAAFDPRAEAPLNRSEEAYALVSSRLLSTTGEEVASFPLARVIPAGVLPLGAGLNPGWADRIHALRTVVLEPLLGPRESLSLEDWREVVSKLEPHRRWQEGLAGNEARGLGIERVRELLASDMRDKILALVEQDGALAPEVDGVALVEKLLRYQRDLHRLLCNFVSFADFYSKRKAVFQAGTLYLDQRSFDLCVRVGDAAAHAAIATQAKTFLAYCECTRKSDGRKMTIAAAITGGTSGDLTVGRNGIFYDRQGADWDATVVRLVEHPISVREAFWLPYQRIGKLIGAQIERFAAARDKDVQEKAAANIEGTAREAEGLGAAPAAAEAPPAKAPFDVAKFAGIFAAIGLAIGAIGSTLAAITAGFLDLAWWQMPLAFGGIVVLVSGPSMAIAWLKLRKRALGPILDANGWAVNSKARINIPFGASLTSLAVLPANSHRFLVDPYAQKRPRIAVGVALAVAVVVLAGIVWWAGWADQWRSALLD